MTRKRTGYIIDFEKNGVFFSPKINRSKIETVNLWETPALKAGCRDWPFFLFGVITMNENSIEISGIFSDGYGINPKKLWKMQLDTHCGHGRGKYVKMVLSYLLSYTGAGSKECWPAIATIAGDLECGKELIIEALKNAEDLKMIRKIRMFPNDPMKTNNKYILDFIEVANSDSGGRQQPPRRSELPTPEVATSDSNNNTINNNTSNKNTIFDGASLPAFAVLLLKNGTEYPILQTFITELEIENPDMDVKASLINAVNWAKRNPAKRKTSRGARTFLANWVARDRKDDRPKPYQPRDKDEFDSEFCNGVLINYGEKTMTEWYESGRMQKESDAMYNYYKGRGWRFKGGDPIIDIEAVIASWIERSMSGEFTKKKAV